MADLMAIIWKEVDPAVPEWSIAGRRDTSVDNRGEAVGALVQFASVGSNTWALNRRIAQELRKREPRVERMIPPKGGNGVLAVVWIEIQCHGDMESQAFRGCSVIGAYREAKHGIWRYTHSSQLEPAAAGSLGSIRRRWFWATRG